jgi:DNA polymerase I-like protein with 3'-5' exonuclease and polymerase domains
MASKVKVPKVNVIDFETDGIKRRPEYPPKPRSVSIQLIGQKKPTFYAWGHPSGNNCDEALPRAIITDLVRKTNEPLLFQNANFDVDVMQTHWDVGPIDWERIHDTLYLLFLYDPHARELKLKPMAEKHLGMAPEEQDAVKDWILKHKRELEDQFGAFTPKEFGMHIANTPAEIVGPYANGDVTRTINMFNFLYPLIVEDGMLPAYNRERELMPIMLENERFGTRLDMSGLRRDIKIYTEAQMQADIWLRKRLKAPNLDLEKDRQIADALEAAGVVTQFRLTPTGQRSVSKKNLTTDMFTDPVVAAVLGYRNRLQTSLTTFMRPWYAMGEATGGRLHTSWNQVRNSEGGGGGARTGRMSCSPNLMNIPTDWYEKGDGYVHPEQGKKAPKAFALPTLPQLPVLRGYVLPDSSAHLFGGRDYNQQELRILGHFEDGDLMRAYQDNPELDTHSFVQGEIQTLLGMPVVRKVIKEINFGTIYGQGVPSLAEKLGEPVETIKQIKAAQLRALPGLKALNEGIKTGAKRDDIPIRTWGGRLYYKEPGMVINGRMVDFGYKLLNYLIQGSAADCTKQGIINYHKIKKEGRFLCSVHDENNISAPKKAMKAELKILGEAMADVNFDVQMLSEPYMGPNWGAVVKFKEGK